MGFQMVFVTLTLFHLASAGGTRLISNTGMQIMQGWKEMCLEENQWYAEEYTRINKMRKFKR
jgi:hypothetical protein